jgi:hypothetical protein
MKAFVTIVVAAGLVALGCGSDDESGLECGAGTHEELGQCIADNTTTGTYESRCLIICDSYEASSGCTDEDKDACLRECRARTDNLSEPCANCIFDNSQKLEADGCDSQACYCGTAEWEPVSSSDCLEFCKSG